MFYLTRSDDKSRKKLQFQSSDEPKDISAPLWSDMKMPMIAAKSVALPL